MRGAAAGASTILHLIETDGPGGAERVLAYLVSRLAKQGYHNVVALPAGGEGWLASQLPATGVEVELVPLRGVSIPTSLRSIADLLRRHRPAVAHSHEFLMSALAGMACWRRKVPHIFTLHGSPYYASRLDRRLAMAFAGRAAHEVVAVSEAQARGMAQDLWLPRDRVRVIPNGIPPVPAVTPTLRAELGLGPEARLIVAVGNLYPVKGHAHLLRAVAALPAMLRESVHLAIAGRGEEGPALTALAAELGLSRRVHLLGLRHDVANVLRSAAVFALPSLSEALPLALLEAMRAGVPVVASAVGEIPQVLEGGQAGLLAAPGDAAALAAALGQLLAEPGRAQALAARAEQVVLERYSIERMAERYVSVYAAAGLRPPATLRE